MRSAPANSCTEHLDGDDPSVYPSERNTRLTGTSSLWTRVRGSHQDRLSVRGVVLLEGERLALIERTRGPELYYVLPGGMLDEGEDAQQAAMREAAEELGLDVQGGALVAEVIVTRRTSVSKQLYLLARAVGGTFGTGTGEEFLSGPDAGHGVYRAVWRSLDECLILDVRPRDLVMAIAAGRLDELVCAPLRVSQRR